MYNVKCGVIVLQFISNNLYCMYIKQFIKSEVFFLYFVLDVVDVFWVIVDFSVNFGLFYFSMQVVDKIMNVLFMYDVVFRKLFGDLFIGIWLLVMKCVVFNFLFELINVKVVSQWCIDVGIFFGSYVVYFIWFVFYFMQVVDLFGKFNYYVVEIIYYCQQYMVYVIYLC